jgi:hypothetical protein
VRILAIGLDCAAPALLFGDEDLVNVRRLMANGANGRLESVVPPITIPAWRCMPSSQAPGLLGVYGFRNRGDSSYDTLQIADARSVRLPSRSPADAASTKAGGRRVARVERIPEGGLAIRQAERRLGANEGLGRSLVSGKTAGGALHGDPAPDREEIIRRRLSRLEHNA